VAKGAFGGLRLGKSLHKWLPPWGKLLDTSLREMALFLLYDGTKCIYYKKFGQRRCSMFVPMRLSRQQKKQD
jgi:hypothetical protein